MPSFETFEIPEWKGKQCIDPCQEIVTNYDKYTPHPNGVILLYFCKKCGSPYVLDYKGDV